MHRKFISLVLSSALVIASLPAAPAYADQRTARMLAGFAALALIGAAISSSNRRAHAAPPPQAAAVPPQPSGPVMSKPARPRISRMDLPGNCLRTKSVNGRQRALFGSRCLKENYGFNDSLPYACQIGYWNGRRNLVGYEPRCLREKGYRFTRR